MVLPHRVHVTNVSVNGIQAPSKITQIIHDVGPPGPASTVPGPKGDKGDPGPVSNPPFVYTRPASSPAANWIVEHNLGRYVEPMVFLTNAPTVPVYPDYECSDENHTTIIFPEPASGRAEF